MFDWVKEFEIILLDFDGLTVNTEQLHYKAYKEMVLSLGFPFPIDYPTYCEGAHISTEALRALVYSKVDGLEEKHPDWMKLRDLKVQLYLEYLSQSAVHLMPGVKELLLSCAHYKVPTCIVTNSPLEQINLIKAQIKELELVNHLVTREDYKLPKPHPDSYLTAIERYAPNAKKIIGFEDTLKGVMSLKNAGITAALIVEKEHPHAKQNSGDYYFESFHHVNFA